MGSFILNERLQLAFDYLSYTGRNVFLTGKAGTGKTTFLKKLREQSPKRLIVTSPTGVAAVNAGGVTLHSFFQLPFGPQTPNSPRNPNKINSQKIQIIKSLELLIIDEISMVRADLLDSVDQVLRRYRNNQKPFGGVQLLLIGDMQQLSPVVKPEDEEILRPYYKSYYFFGSIAWQKTSYVCIELNEVFRQTDQNFISILNEIREGCANNNTIQKLNQRYVPDYKPPIGEDIVTLVTTNSQADTINQTHILELTTQSRHYYADIKGDFPESSYPTENDLFLKIDAVVMFLKNDTSQSKRFYNGKIGRITNFDDDYVYVKCNDESEEIRVQPLTWENTKYVVDSETKEIREEVIGTFQQLPLKIAWAVTIHKSQGLTFDKLLINASHSFAHGQVYVALSRCRTLDGLILLKPLSLNDIKYDPQVEKFAEIIEQRMPNNTVLVSDKRDYFFDTIEELFNFSPIFNGLQNLKRFLELHSNTIVGNINIFDGLDSLVYSDLITIAEKFLLYVRQHYSKCDNVDSDEALCQRISNGCRYYIEKMENCLETPIKSFEFECQDKNKKNKINELYESLIFDFDFRKRLLSALKDNYSLDNYMKHKARIAVEMTEGSDDAQKSRIKGLGKTATKMLSKNPELAMQLFEWRSKKAALYKVEVKEIVSTKCLIEISNIMPTDIATLKTISGMKGKAKIYSGEILNEVIIYMVQKGFMINYETARLKALEEAEFESLPSHEKTFRLWERGLSLSEIEKERGLLPQTILGHLVQYVQDGRVDPLKLISQEVFEAIKIIILENPCVSDKKIMELTNNKFSYSQIKIVRAAYEASYDNY